MSETMKECVHFIVLHNTVNQGMFMCYMKVYNGIITNKD